MQQVDFTQLLNIPEPTVLTANNERGDVIQMFVNEINKQRVGTVYKLVTWGQINGRLAHVKDLGDLYYFYKKCKQGDSFGKVFWGSLKIKK